MGITWKNLGKSWETHGENRRFLCRMYHWRSVSDEFLKVPFQQTLGNVNSLVHVIYHVNSCDKCASTDHWTCALDWRFQLGGLCNGWIWWGATASGTYCGGAKRQQNLWLLSASYLIHSLIFAESNPIQTKSICLSVYLCTQYSI
jgi:hypothetical protein